MGLALKVRLKTNMKPSTVLSTVASVCIALELSIYVSESIQTPLNYHPESLSNSDVSLPQKTGLGTSICLFHH